MNIDRRYVRNVLSIVNVLYIQRRCNELATDILSIRPADIICIIDIGIQCDIYHDIRNSIIQQRHILTYDHLDNSHLESRINRILLRLNTCRSLLLSVLDDVVVLHPTDEMFNEVMSLKEYIHI